jgi:HEAT repeat protein
MSIKTILLFMILFPVIHGITYAQPELSKETIPTNVAPDIRIQIERLYNSNPEERAKAAKSLGEAGVQAGPAIPFLIGIFHDEHPILSHSEDRKMESTSPAREASIALSRIGPPGVKPLIAALKDENVCVRFWAAKTLGEIKDARAVEPLGTLLKDKKSKIQQIANEALHKTIENMKDKQETKHLLDVLKSKECVVRLMAVKALQDIKDISIVEPLIHCLEDDDRAVREQAAEILGKIKDSRAVGPLISTFLNGDRDIQKSARKALVNIGEPAVEPLILSLTNEKPQIRTMSASILGDIGDSHAVIPLIDSLQDESWNVRYEAAKALGKIKDPHAVEPLIDAMNDKSTDVRANATKALAEIGIPALESLIIALKNEKMPIRSSAASILGDIGNSHAVIPLIDSLQDESWVVRYEAAKALGKIKDPHAIEPLKDALNDRVTNVREVAEGALEKIRVANTEIRQSK